jgi:uncharacterized protein YndB with AHSA1/START domain
MSDSAGSTSRYVAALVVRRTINASAQQLFDAWTDPSQLVQWWGPEGVKCKSAEVDLRPGGVYRIANLLPDGRTLWIRGAFERIEPPHCLVYSWQIEGSERETERVTVQFVAAEAATEVIVTHERVADEATRQRHAHGWAGCLDGLARIVSARTAAREERNPPTARA